MQLLEQIETVVSIEQYSSVQFGQFVLIGCAVCKLPLMT